MNTHLRLEIKRKSGCSDLPLPEYKTDGAAGMDLSAAVEKPLSLKPGEHALIPTGIHIAVPEGHEAQVRPRSGLALRHGISVLNTPGTIDSDYRAEVGVILVNFGNEPFVVERGMRIAQMVISPVTKVQTVEVADLDETERQFGGFGSTGTK